MRSFEAIWGYLRSIWIRNRFCIKNIFLGNFVSILSQIYFGLEVHFGSTIHHYRSFNQINWCSKLVCTPCSNVTTIVFLFPFFLSRATQNSKVPNKRAFTIPNFEQKSLITTVIWGRWRSFEVIWCHILLSEVIWGQLRSSEVNWGHSKLFMQFEVIWCHILSSEVIWGHLRSIFKVIWGHLKSCKAFRSYKLYMYVY